MVIDGEIEAKTYYVSNNHGWVTQRETFESIFQNNPTDFLSVSDLPID